MQQPSQQMKLSKALAPHSIAEECNIEITPGVFSVRIIEANPRCQAYHLKVAQFAASNPDHPCKDSKSQFWGDLWLGKLTDATWSFLRDVLVVDWSLIDDDGNDVPFTAEAFDYVLGSDEAGQKVAWQLMRAAQNESTFKVELILKN